MSQTTHRPAWTRSEKALIGGSIAVVTIGIASITALRHQEELPKISIPNPQMPSPNAFDFFTKAGSMVLDGTKIGFAIGSSHTPPSSSSPDDHPYIQAEKELLVRENITALKTLRQGFAYPYVNPPTRSFSTLLPYYAKERGLARLLRLEAQTRKGRGDWGGAVDSSLDAVQEGEMISHGSVLIGSLVGIACEAIGRRQIWQTTEHLTAAEARKAALRLESISANEASFAETMQEEEWLGQAGLLEVLQKSNWRQLLGQMYSPDDTDAARGMEVRLLLWSKRRVLERYTAYMDNAISNARQPYAAGPQTPAMTNDPLVQMICPAFDGARIKAADNQTQNALLMTTLALRAYRLEHGSYPDTLTALMPTYLKAVPLDPFALSKPLHYHRTGIEYVLYSVGPDGKDDGGKPIFDPTEPAPTSPDSYDQRRFIKSDSKGDAVAGINTT